MYGWQVMTNSFSNFLELQKAISLKPFGQIWWGFFLQVLFDPLFPKMYSSFIKTSPCKMAFFGLVLIKFKYGAKSDFVN
jgi:hypothetical protein